MLLTGWLLGILVGSADNRDIYGRDAVNNAVGETTRVAWKPEQSIRQPRKG